MGLEAHRVLRRPHGYLMLTTPNANSFRAFKNLLRGRNPYDYSFYVPHQGKTHSHEYSMLDIYSAFNHTGYTIVAHETHDVYGNEAELPEDAALREVYMQLADHYPPRVYLNQMVSYTPVLYGCQWCGTTHFVIAQPGHTPLYRSAPPLYEVSTLSPFAGYPRK
eukprot:TRINITY_DN8889_c0_g1_i1.p1 TRINITY_DN8889_c0_g1~~TRINITY_DN8889_c0_g1_i1.p1  ORF type:complete len:172 (-),score=22.16 TRINITY_DN8889_c0_g1_i1:68-559(-)